MDISQVTLCAIDSEPELAVRAMNICLKQCEFGDAVLITNKHVHAPFRVEEVDFKTINPSWYSTFCVKQLVDYIHTPFVLLVQYDGYVVNPECWDDEFLEYDYIGAVWPLDVGVFPPMLVREFDSDTRMSPVALTIPDVPKFVREFDCDRAGVERGDMTGGRKIMNIVGNGGFSLRSRKLLEAMAKLPAPGIDEPEDNYICLKYREELEEGGIRFAPLRLARKFAYEWEAPDCDTFGFHGFLNMWRHAEEPEIMKMMTTYAASRSDFRKLMTFYEKP